MDLNRKRNLDPSVQNSSSAMSDSSRNPNFDQSFMQFNSPNESFAARPGQSFAPGFLPFFGPQSSNLCRPDDWETKTGNQLGSNPAMSNPILDWDPEAMLSNLTFLEQKIHQVKDLVRSIANQESQLPNRTAELAKQQLVSADLTCIIIQLISTAGSLLPSMKNPLLTGNLPVRQLGTALGTPVGFAGPSGSQQPSNEVMTPEIPQTSEYEELIRSLNNGGDEGDELIKCLPEGSESMLMEEHDAKESDDGGEGENLPPGSYVVLQLEKEEILAPHTHFCLICGKGFKRDANLRMHMRGHGDEYKTRAALAKPTKDSTSEPALITRYSCPFVGCKRNKEHKKFQPLKTILCVKNHYKRSHCDKSYTCSRCNTKKFSVIADLKTHEKHCGRDKWLCSCGTTFSRKDKLFGHVALFQGHTPALPMDDVKIPGAPEQAQGDEGMNGMARSMGCNFAGSSSDEMPNLDIKGVDDSRGYFSPMNFDACNFGGLDDFARPAFDDFSFLPPPGSCGFGRNGDS